MIDNTNFKNYDDGLHIQQFINFHKYVEKLNKNERFHDEEIGLISVDQDCTYYSL